MQRLGLARHSLVLPASAGRIHGKPCVEGGLRIGYHWDRGKHEVALFGRNIPHRKAIIGGIDFDNLTGYVNEPRTWGMQLRAEP